ncbi:helix-turn-helix domain-containing protein [Methylobacter sp. S3L5C]|uniref:helix-turn-helix domain-containing protein n=1 Tax=Methylobacter sp. S3L5C TaxID=2839024 RepID=UPI001FAE7059|nr:helix-turn-helix transcriptional regulator [Methylobacter sp. S3L5C]UOA07661.1 helix-turn-helix domain-containing protein [Methylobacter sp. S3L5C]
MTIGARLKQWREYRNLNQEEASSLLGTPFSTLQKYEMNISKPGADAIIRFIDAGINATWLLKGVGPMLVADYDTKPTNEPVAPSAAPAEPVESVIDAKCLQTAIEEIELELIKRRRTMRPDVKTRVFIMAYHVLVDEKKEKELASHEYAKQIVTKLMNSVT